MNAKGWSRGLEVTGGGTGVVSHAGLVLLRQLADRAGLTAGLSAALPSPLAACDNVGEPLAWMLRPGSAGGNTASDHLSLLAGAVAALPPALRRRLMVTCDGAGASHELVGELDRLASRHG